MHIELEPGSAVFWHANLLHRSDSNLSDEPRWSFICCYNVAWNTAGPGHRSYQPVDAWGAAGPNHDRSVKGIGEAQLAALREGVVQVISNSRGGLKVLDAAKL